MATTLGNLYDIPPSKRNTVTRIDRWTIFGNRNHMSSTCTRDEACDKYEIDFEERITKSSAFKKAVLALRGHKLYCWCTPRRCHGETIIKWLEAHREEG